MSIKMKELSRAEHVVLWRRRKGWNQTRLAKYLRISVHEVKQLEHGAYPSVTADFLGCRINAPFTAAEQCFIARRRAGRSQAEVARDLGRCRYWVNRMELGLAPCHELTDYWFA
jgi:DNA-binding XRE family transcriptional regulator